MTAGCMKLGPVDEKTECVRITPKDLISVTMSPVNLTLQFCSVLFTHRIKTTVGNKDIRFLNIVRRV